MVLMIDRFSKSNLKLTVILDNLFFFSFFSFHPRLPIKLERIQREMEMVEERNPKLNKIKHIEWRDGGGGGGGRGRGEKYGNLKI